MEFMFFDRIFIGYPTKYINIGVDIMEHEVLTISAGSIETGETDVKVTIEGNSEMSYWNHDLKVKAIIALLNSIDIKHYYEDNIQDKGFQSANEIIETTKAAFGLDLFDFD